MQTPPPLTIVKNIIKKLAQEKKISKKKLMHIIRITIKNTGYAFPTGKRFLEAYKELLQENFSTNKEIEEILKIKSVRSDSGIAPITVLTKPFPCPGNCVYCPADIKMPKSYLANEPAAARALSLKFDPYEQVFQRVQALEKNGHQANKIELIIKGGTWSAYPQIYREWFILRCFQAANDLQDKNKHDEYQYSNDETENIIQNNKLIKSSKLKNNQLDQDLITAQNKNETAEYRIIGLTIETRPDWITVSEIIHLRKLGCTRVELGLQIINDQILKLTKRGTTVADAKKAIALLKTAAFKVDVHIMPGQPGTTTQDDLQSFQELFNNPDFRPDMVKIYPCVILPQTELYKWYQEKKFQPLEGEKLEELLIQMQSIIPKYCRVPRVIRDFSTKDILAGNKKSNLRETIEEKMKKQGLQCQCLRCREVNHVPGDHSQEETQLFREDYQNADGTEVFLSIENKNRTAVFAFLRLRLPKLNPQSTYYQEELKIWQKMPILSTSSFIREVHTYGQALKINQHNSKSTQHKGYGKQLMQEAEKISKDNNYQSIAVISGIGVRGYYKMLGYHEKDTYMVKNLSN